MISTSFKSFSRDSIGGQRGTQVLAREILSQLRLDGVQQHLGSLQIIDVQGHSGAALRLSTLVGSTQEWHVQVVADTSRAIAVGDVVLARYRMRCVESM